MASSDRRVLRRLAALPAVACLVLAGASCSADTAAPAPGITSAPCPQSPHTDRGCLYLGVLSDLEGGPFTALGVSMNEGQRAFWDEVNKAGGIGGYDIDLATYTRNTAYDPRTHRTAYQEISPHVLALAMSFGTAQTLAMLNDMDADDMVATAATQWSGWGFRSADRNLVLSGGYSYCVEAINALDWFTQDHYHPQRIAVVGYRGTFGEDFAAGAMRWAVANEAAIADTIETGPNNEVGNQDSTVAQVLAAQPDLVTLATGPAETAEIVGKLVKSGYTGRFLGSLITWNPALLKSPAAPALTALYNFTSPIDSWDGNSIGAQRARRALGHEPNNLGYNLGWAISYPMRALLTKAAATGELTRTGLRRTMENLLPDSEGIAPVQRIGASAPDPSIDWSVVYTPDEQAPVGARVVRSTYRGPTLGKTTLTEPCKPI
ncbi:ABC transporter substrate-binding protein [Nocardia thailandica]|uniref:ABC transporter substrate-binding protein n=1 Tax=Nocardia thailandica TaxID=257275 RepID=UPI0002DF10F3|nr:ABC transporter substrate-binding protein [Nocardia thailandica]